MLCYSKRLQSKIHRGQGTRGDIWEKQGRFPRASPVGSQGKHLLPPATSCDNNCWNMVSQGGSQETQCPRICTGNRSHNHFLSAMYLNSTLLEGRQVVSISNSLPRQFSHSKPLLSVRERWGPPHHHLRISVPRCQPRANLTNKITKDGSLRPAVSTIFCTVSHWSGYRWKND